MTSEWIHYFGYGSLVNRDTRPPDEPSICARLDGWKRVWGHRVQRSGEHAGCTSLSVLPSNGAIDGVVVRMPAANLPMLDERAISAWQYPDSNLTLMGKLMPTLFTCISPLRRIAVLPPEQTRFCSATWIA